MAAVSPASAATYRFKLSEQGGSEGPTEAEVATAARQVAALDSRREGSLKASIRHYLARNPGEAIRDEAGQLDYEKMLPLWLAHTTKHREARKRSRSSMGVRRIKVAASVRPRPPPQYSIRLGEMAGTEPSVVHSIFESLRALAVGALQQKKRFVFPSIAAFSLKGAKGIAGTKRIGERVFEAKAVPAAYRASCTAAHELQRAVFASTPPAPAAPHPAWKAFCERLVASTDETTVTLESVGAVITSLRDRIIQELRTRGMFVIEGLVTFKTADVPARHAEYVHNAAQGKVVLYKAKRSRRCVYGRVHARLQRVFVDSRRKGFTKRAHIRRSVELRQYGFTEGCPGCEAAAKGSKELGHSAACRRRIEANMLEDEISAMAVLRAKMRKGQIDGAACTAKQAYRATSAKAELLFLTRAAAAASASAEQAGGARRRRRHKGP